MGLTNEHVGPKILAKIKIYILTRAELLFTLCYEIPCILRKKSWSRGLVKSCQKIGETLSLVRLMLARKLQPAIQKSFNLRHVLAHNYLG